MKTSPVIAVPWPKPDYLASIERAGATARVLVPSMNPIRALDDVDGLLLTGGSDVDPREYGDRDTHPTVEADAVRDAFELPLTREAIAHNLPILAICRGAQVLNVAAGGTLIQDIPSATHTATNHAIDVPKDAIAHDVVVTPGTCLAALFTGGPGGGSLAVNSRHHQSVKDVAPGFVTSAVSADGIIEAIEKPDAAFCVGVQWHPENFWRGGEFGSLFDAFVRAAANRERLRA